LAAIEIEGNPSFCASRGRQSATRDIFRVFLIFFLSSFRRAQRKEK